MWLWLSLSAQKRFQCLSYPAYFQSHDVFAAQYLLPDHQRNEGPGADMSHGLRIFDVQLFVHFEVFAGQPHAAQNNCAHIDFRQFREALRFASAAAALKCTRFGGAFAAPQRAEVTALLGQGAGAGQA